MGNLLKVDGIVSAALGASVKTGGRLVDGAILARIPAAKAKMEMHLRIAMNLTLPYGETWFNNMGADDRMTVIHSHLRDTVFPTLEPFLS